MPLALILFFAVKNSLTCLGELAKQFSIYVMYATQGFWLLYINNKLFMYTVFQKTPTQTFVHISANYVPNF